jgi:hypothetical protein
MLNIIKIIVLTFVFVASSQAAVYENWSSGEPNDSGSCGWMYPTGKWDDSGCDRDEPTLCYNGKSWLLGYPSRGLFGGVTNTDPEEQCSNTGLGYKFAVPYNDYENEAVRVIVEASGESRVRINLAKSGSVWNSNSGVPFITRWYGPDPLNFDEPDDGGTYGNQDCVAMDRQGYWHDTDCGESLRFVCAQVGSQWYISDSESSQDDLYAGERACRDSSKLYTFEAPESDGSNVNIVNRLSSAYSDSLTYGDRFWVNVNDRLTEGTFQASENRYFWRLGADAGSSEPNNVNNEDCVEKNSGSEWNDVDCAPSNQPYACFHMGTGGWTTTAILAGIGDDFIAGAAACQAEGPKWSFWAPHSPSQNTNAPQNAWFNITDKAVEGRWEANNRAYFWGKTDLYNLNDDFFYVYQTTVSQPNNGAGVSQYDRRVPELNIGSNEDCAVQLSDGTWHDLPCSNANAFACYDKDTDEWLVAGASPNLGVYFGEAKCQALDATRRFHFSVPENRQQQNDISTIAGASVWVNASDRAEENTWKYNEYLTFWDANEPVADDAIDCAVSTSALDGKWSARACGESHGYLCKNGNSWLIASANSLENQSGIIACEAAQAGAEYAAPNTFDELDSLNAFYAGNSGAEVLWINATDVEQENNWQYNQQRFWQTSEPDLPSGNAAENCAVMLESNGLWVSVSCEGTDRQSLCFDGSSETWALSGNPVGDQANFSQGQNACEALNTSALDNYLFAAPNYAWENSDAHALLAGNGDVWINGNDRIVENRWIFNEYLYWSATSLNDAPEGKDCLTMNVSGYWQDTDCAAGPYKVACFSGDGWYLSPTTRDLSNFSEAQRACKEIGDGYRFYSPISVEHNRELRALIGTDENIWINGIDIAEEGKWVFNSAGLPTPNWLSGQPDGVLDENCAYINEDGLWLDAPCSDAKKLTCLNASGEQFITSAEFTLEDHFDSAHSACIAEGGISFFAPTTFNQNESLRQLMAEGDQVWVNTTDALIESRWALNIATTAEYITITPNTAAIDGCASLDTAGLVSVGSCSPAQAKSVTCYDGNEWRISNTKVVLGVTATDGKLIRNAFAACQTEYSGDFTFAVPVPNLSDPSDRSAQWELAQALALSGENSVWLNLADWHVATEFSGNMPYQNISSTETLSTTGCAFIDDQSDGWLIQQACDQKAAHFACYNGSNWQVAPADGTIEDPSTPQDGVDGWDQSYGDLRCKEFFGPGYSFTAPISPKEDAALKQVVNRFDNQVKDTWINYYANRFMSGNGQQWFADRINMSIIDAITLDQGSTSEDCGALTNNLNTLKLTDEKCTASHQALCYNGTGWFVTLASVQWNQAAAECGQMFDEEHIFALPRDAQERSAVLLELAKLPDLTQVWTNYSDLSIESKWRANAPLRQWWANEEPQSRGNRDCVVLDSTGDTAGQWRSDYCDQVFHSFACKNGTQWQVTTDQGIWAQGFTACRKLGDGWHFDYPEDYFANLNVATTLAGDFDNVHIQAATGFAGKSAWINLTDQYREKDWQRGRQFNDWAVNFSFDDNRDCAYLDKTVTEIDGQAVQGSWIPGLCHESDSVRKFACTNGTNWLLADALPADLGNNWSAGFDACDALEPEGSWDFSAPVTSFDNERLKAALGQESAWINLQDVGTDGDWAANLTKPNLPPIIKFSLATALINTNPVNEKLTGLTLEASIIDPEGGAIQTVTITEENGLASSIVNVTAMPCASSCTYQVTYTAPALTNVAKELKFKLTATDVSGKSTFTYMTVEVLPPIIAWYDFDDSNRTNYDKTGNGNDAIDNPEQPYDFPPIKNGAIEISQGNEKMTVDGSKLAMPKDYAIALRIWADGEDEAEHQQFKIEFLLGNGDQTAKCLDLPGSGVGAAVVDANVSIYDCDNGIDQLWYQDADGYIHSAANDELCLAHPGDGNDLNTNLRNIQISYCSNVKHPWGMHNGGLENGAIEAGMHSGYYLYANSSNNGTNLVLANTSPTRKWNTDKTFGRGILQKGPSANQPLLTFADKTSKLTYTVGDDSGTTLAPLAEEQWVNVVVNVEGTELTLFVDGVAETPVTLNTAAVANNDDLIIGNIPSALRSFIGRIDEVQVFSRPLTALEIEAVLPEPPVGFAQFELSNILRQEPQAQGVSLVNPVVILRTDGSNGYFRATVSSTAGTANDSNDFDPVNQVVTWAPNEAPIYLTPEYDLLPVLSAIPGEAVNAVEFNRDDNLVVAIDISIHPTSPRGVVWEQGSSETGVLVAFNTADQLIVRVGTGNGVGANVARLVVPKADVDSKLVNKAGTLFVEINKSAGSVSAWFLENGLMATTEIEALGSATASSGFPNGLWTDGSAGAVANASSLSARYIRDQVNGSNENTSAHWVEIEAWDTSGVNVARTGGVSISGYDQDDVAIANSNYGLVNDGDSATSPYLDLGTGLRKVIVDLGSVQELASVNIRHYWSDSRQYNNTVTEISNDGVIWTPIFESSVSGTYVETSTGHNLDRIVAEAAVSVAGDYSYNGTLSIARFYHLTMPVQRIVDNAKLIAVTLHNESPFDREPTERFDLNVIQTERSVDGSAWTPFAEGKAGYFNTTEVALTDYTKNAAGIFQLAVSEMTCSEPHAADNSGTVSVAGEASPRYYRSCEIEVQRRTGGVGEVAVEFAITAQGLSYAFADEAAVATSATDVLFDSHATTLNFSHGVRTQSIGFRALSDFVDTYENNESFRISLFNPRNITTPENRPWMGDPIGAKVIIEDYALGTIEMSVSVASASEPRFEDAAFAIHTASIVRRNGSNGPAHAQVTASDIAEWQAVAGIDYQMVDVDGADLAGPIDVTWLDGQNATQTVYIKVFSDQVQEYIGTGQSDDAAASCYDAPTGDGFSDDGDRNCFASEAFKLSLTHVSGAPLGSVGDANSRNTRETRVNVHDNTASADLTFTNDTVTIGVLDERADLTQLNDIDNDGVYDETKEGLLVPDVNQAISITRSNRYAEHGVFIEITGADGIATLPASIGSDVTLRAVNDLAILGGADNSATFAEDATFVGSDAARRFLLVMPADAANATVLQTVTVNIEILDNNRAEAENREAQIRMYAAGDRDKKVIEFPVFASATEEVTNFEIHNVNLPPIFIREVNDTSFAFPIRNGGSMAVKYNIELNNDSQPNNNSPIVDPANYSIKALDQDWIDVTYSIDDGVQLPQASTGEYPGWSFDDISTQWDYLQPFNTATGAPYLPFIRNFAIEAKDSENVAVNTNITFVRIKPRWMRIQGFGNCVRETGNDVQDNNCTNDGASQWLAVPDKNVANAYRLINGWEGKCMTANAAANDADIRVATCTDNNPLQRWQFDAAGSSIRLRQDDDDYKLCEIWLSGGDLRIRTGGCTDGAAWSEWNNGSYVPR